ncbi:FAD-dependent oxidoreductase [Romboutsia lituseburensis]|uniref:FAD-dependent oxidoreductase n=1 Tax=Romboutsia lituseburensis TaxID=1537 RepID=UPI002ED1CBF0
MVATGSRPKILNIEGTDKLFTAEEVLLGKKDAGKSTIIIGGGLVGCETALWLQKQGKKVTIVEMMDDILAVGGPICHANHDMLKDLIHFKDINVKCSAKVTKADSAIAAIGYNSENSLYDKIRFSHNNVRMIGDANEVKNIMYAIWDAFEVARHI